MPPWLQDRKSSARPGAKRIRLSSQRISPLPEEPCFLAEKYQKEISERDRIGKKGRKYSAATAAKLCAPLSKKLEEDRIKAEAKEKKNNNRRTVNKKPWHR